MTTSNQKDLIDVINDIFRLFKASFNTYKYAPNSKEENESKRVYLSVLSAYPPATIQQAAYNVISKERYMPSPGVISEECKRVLCGNIPDVWAAFREASAIRGRLAEHSFSHPIVYHVGSAVGWHWLHNAKEEDAIKVFSKAYDLAIERLAHGESFLPPPPSPALPDQSNALLTKSENLLRIKELRKELKI